MGSVAVLVSLLFACRYNVAAVIDLELGTLFLLFLQLFSQRISMHDAGPCKSCYLVLPGPSRFVFLFNHNFRNQSQSSILPITTESNQLQNDLNDHLFETKQFIVS